MGKNPENPRFFLFTGRDTRTSTQSRRLVRRKDASWSLNWPSGATLLVHEQHKYFFWCLCDYRGHFLLPSGTEKLKKYIALTDRIGPKDHRVSWDRANDREISCVLKHIRSFKEQLFGRLEKFDDHFASNSVVKIGDFRHRYSLKSPQRSNV